jgi:hypothetical protein
MRLRGVAKRFLLDVSQLRALRYELTTMTRMGQDVESIPQIVEIELPDRMRRTMVVDGEEQVLVISGNRGFFGVGGQSLPLPEPQVERTVEQLRRDLLVLAAGVGSDGLTVESGGREKIGELSCDVLDVSYGPVRTRLFVADDGDVVRQSYLGSDPLSGTTGRVDISYSGYRESGGVRFPTIHAITFEGQPLVAVEIDHLEVNPSLDPSLFAVSDSD